MKKIIQTSGICMMFAMAACFGKEEKKEEIAPPPVEKTTIHIVSDFDYYPFVYKDPKDTDPANPNANKKGMEVDILSELAKRLDFNVTFEELKFEEIMEAVSTGRPGVDGAIGGISITPGRKAKVLFTSPVYKSPLVVLTPHHQENQTVEGENKSQNTQDQDIAYELFTVSDPDFADFASEELSKKYDKIKTSNRPLTADVLDNFENSRSGFYLTDRVHAQYLVKNYPNLKIAEEFTDNTSLNLGGGLPIAFAFNPKHQALVIRINEELTKMEEDGTLKKIFDHYAESNQKYQGPEHQTIHPSVVKEMKSDAQELPKQQDSGVDQVIETMIESPFEPETTVSE